MPRERLSVVRSTVPLLTVFGVSPDADLVFRVLVEHGPQHADWLGRALGIRLARITAALDELVDSDAVRPSRPPGRRASNGRTWHPSSPETVVASLRKRQAWAAQASMEVRRRLVALAELDPDLCMDPDRTTARPLHGVNRIRSRLTELVQATQHEHLSMHPEPAFDTAKVQASAPLDYDLLARNVSVLTLGVPPASDDVTAAHTLELTRAGLQYREMQTLPTKMIILDRRVAIVPMDPSDTSKGALELAAPPIVERLAVRFMQLWASARPPESKTAATAPLTARERRVIQLLAAGYTDASAAIRLGLSERTVSYAVRGLMERYGVQNRFQLGLVLGTAQPPQLPPENYTSHLDNHANHKEDR
jgi:DNA-binding CsgD family transcriptional regulator/sugar-specific transcriptional regulator TrmB